MPSNPHWEILQGTATGLTAVSGCPTPQVREIPYVLTSLDTPPLCFVCPPTRGEKVHKHLFRRSEPQGEPSKGITLWDYPVLVLLIFAGNRALTSGLQARLQIRHDVGEALFVTTLAGTAVLDCDPDPQAVAEVQAALGTNFIVSGFLVNYRYPRERA